MIQKHNVYAVQHSDRYRYSDIYKFI